MKFFKLDEVKALKITYEGGPLGASDPVVDEYLTDRSTANRIWAAELVDEVKDACHRSGLMFVYDEWVGEVNNLEGLDDDQYPTLLLEDWITMAMKTYNK